MFPCDRAHICCPLSNLSLCLFPRGGAPEEAQISEPALHERLLCQHDGPEPEADAIGYAYPTRDIFMENSGPRTFYSRNRAAGCLISGKHTQHSSAGLPGLANENTGYPGKFELQINNEYILSISPTLHGPYLALFYSSFF